MPASIAGGDPTLQYVSGIGPAEGGTGQRGESLTTNTFDPADRKFRDLLRNLLVSQVQTGGQVPGYTTARLEEFTKDPSSSVAKFFPQLAEPLLQANRDAQAVQSRNVIDTFRKAGGAGAGTLQAGSFAQAGRQLATDFARQDQETLAKAYTPLTAQLSENTNNAIRAGLALPEAQAGYLRNLIPVLTGLQPTEVRTQTTGVQAPIVAPGGAITPGQQQANIQQQQAGYANLNGFGGGSLGGFYR
jgi:hypothetical protein